MTMVVHASDCKAIQCKPIDKQSALIVAIRPAQRNMLARLITGCSMSIVAADLAIPFLSLFAFNHFITQQQRARSVGTANAASINEINIGGWMK
jgi:hypothetical protein